MPKMMLTAANDNPGGKIEIDLALAGLVDVLAKAEAKRLAAGLFVGSVDCGEPANTPTILSKGTTQ